MPQAVRPSYLLCQCLRARHVCSGHVRPGDLRTGLRAGDLWPEALRSSEPPSGLPSEDVLPEALLRARSVRRSGHVRSGGLRTGLRAGHLLPEALLRSSLPPSLPSPDVLPEDLLRARRLHPGCRSRGDRCSREGSRGLVLRRPGPLEARLPKGDRPSRVLG